MAEPTSILTFRDLIIEVAIKLGVAYYGADGDGEPQVPQDVHDLHEVKRHVNNGIRMFMAAGPPNGWRWARPTHSLTLWASVAVDSSNTVTFAGYDPIANKSTLTVTSDAFFASMEEKDMVITDIGTFTITNYVSATSVKVSGDITSSATGKTFSVTADGNYTLPATYGGLQAGLLTYGPNSDEGLRIAWSTDSEIRTWRADVTDETGDPFLAAIRPKDPVIGSRRRWEMMVYPSPDANQTVQFPYAVYFDRLVDLDDVSPAPFYHDDTIRAACLATAEKDGEGVAGPDSGYFSIIALPNSRQLDASSAPKKVGTLSRQNGLSRGEAVQLFRSVFNERPTVTFNP